MTCYGCDMAPENGPDVNIPAAAPVEAVAPIVEVASAAAPAPVELAPVVEVPVEAAPAPEPVAEPVVEATPEPVIEAAPEAEKPAEEKPAEAPKLDPVAFTDFKMPEGIAAAPEQITAFTDLLNKVDPRTQEGAQALIDLHTKSLQDFVKTYTETAAQQQRDTYDKMRGDWRKDFEKQTGNRRDSTLNDAKFALAEAVKDKKERDALDNVLGAVTGAGDHPLLITALARLGRRLRERSAPPQGVPMHGEATNPAARRYGPAPKR